MYNVGFCKSIVFKQKQSIRDRKLNPVCLWVSFLLTIAFIYNDGNNLTFSSFFRLAESRFSSPWANFICGLINTGNAGGHAVTARVLPPPSPSTFSTTHNTSFALNADCPVSGKRSCRWAVKRSCRWKLSEQVVSLANVTIDKCSYP